MYIPKHHGHDNKKQLTEEEAELTAFILSSVQRGEKLRREISNFVEKVSVFAPENPDIFAETLAQIILRNSKRCLQKAQAVGDVPHSEAAAVYGEFAQASYKTNGRIHCFAR